MFLILSSTAGNEAKASLNKFLNLVDLNSPLLEDLRLTCILNQVYNHISLIDSEIVGTAIKCLFEMKKDL